LGHLVGGDNLGEEGCGGVDDGRLLGLRGRGEDLTEHAMVKVGQIQQAHAPDDGPATQRIPGGQRRLLVAGQ
jgi:hypothetical protein